MSVFLIVMVLVISAVDIMGNAMRNAMRYGLGNCLTSVHQPDERMWEDRGQPVTLLCNVTHHCAASVTHEVLWFIFDDDSHHQLSVPSAKYRLDQNDLTIQSIQTNDSGVYYCAAVLNNVMTQAPLIGQGTTLVVRGEGMQVVWHALLWSLFVLLAFYSLIVLLLIFFKKTGQEINLCRGTWKTGRKNNSTKREQFRAVVQELYGKRKLRSNPKKPNHNDKVESPHSNLPDDDIYQNL